MLPAERDALLSTLLLSARLQALWDVRDRGMPVFAHSIDVAFLCLDEMARGDELDREVVLFGALLHDVTKLPSADTRSHSYLMRTSPWEVADRSLEVLADAERRCGVTLARDRRAALRHVVESHHGAHGRVQPGSPEARLVAHCDQISGTVHRLAPVDANDILPLLAEGYRWGAAAHLLGVTKEIVKTRLREACDAATVREWVDLLPIWRQRGAVTPGTPERQRQIARARTVVRLARQVPESVLERLGAPVDARETVLEAAGA